MSTFTTGLDHGTDSVRALLVRCDDGSDTDTHLALYRAFDATYGQDGRRTSTGVPS